MSRISLWCPFPLACKRNGERRTLAVLRSAHLANGVFSGWLALPRYFHAEQARLA